MAAEKMTVIPEKENPGRLNVREQMESKGQYSVRQWGGRAGSSRCAYAQPLHPPRPAKPDGQ